MLVNVPLVNQLAEPTTDGGPDEAARANCVPASLTSAVLSLVPGAQINGQAIDGDALRDLVYPESYTGATDPAAYGAVLASHFGIALVEYQSADGAALVQHAITALESHEPVSAAIPSEWGLNFAGQDMVHFAGGTHEVTFCDYNPATSELTAMNPWPVNGSTAFYQSQPAAWWAERIVYGRVFVLAGGHPMSNVTPVWNATAGTLAYPAHDGIPAITLEHMQASYAQANRAGRYPLAPAFYDAATGDSLVGWNDGLDSRADKDSTAGAWTVSMEDSGPRIAAALAVAALAAAGQQALATLAKVKADLGVA